MKKIQDYHNLDYSLADKKMMYEIQTKKLQHFDQIQSQWCTNKACVRFTTRLMLC
ncbi:unnamed protein product [Arabidopsis lyrata]|nr:unnamed protein product [Arabidopsis lyrata]